MSNHVRIRDRKRKGARAEHTPRNRKSRPKTFASEELAKRWAKENGIENYELQNLKTQLASAKKIRIIISDPSA